MTFDEVYDQEHDDDLRFDEDAQEDPWAVFPHDDLDEDPRDLWAMRHRGDAAIEAVEIEPPARAEPTVA